MYGGVDATGEHLIRYSRPQATAMSMPRTSVPAATQDHTSWHGVLAQRGFQNYTTSGT